MMTGSYPVLRDTKGTRREGRGTRSTLRPSDISTATPEGRPDAGGRSKQLRSFDSCLRINPSRPAHPYPRKLSNGFVMVSIDGFERLDVLEAHREGLLDDWVGGAMRLGPGRGSAVWIRRFGRLGLNIYRSGLIVGRPGAFVATVGLEFSTYPLGGARAWLVCPGCGRRRVYLYYSGWSFECRDCLQLHYPVEHESPFDRAIRRALRLRHKLGWGGDLLAPLGQRPKGMHHRTFRCLREDYMKAVLEGLVTKL